MPRRSPSSSSELSPERRADAEFYICGPTPFMDVVEATLTATTSIPAADPHRALHPADAAGRPPPTDRPPPSRRTGQATRRVPNGDDRARRPIRQHRRTGPAPRSCRRPANSGLTRPSRAKSGNCATCMAKLVEGTVDDARQQRARPTTRSTTAGCSPASPCRPRRPVHVVYGYDGRTDEWPHRRPSRTRRSSRLEQLLARYAVGMTQDDVDAVIEVFTPDGTYRAFGDTYPLADFPTLVAAAPKGLFMVGTAGARPRRRRRAPASSRCASSTRPTTTCASAGTPTPTAAPSRAGACRPGR